MLCNRHGHASNVNFLKAVLSKLRNNYVTGNCHHRYRIHVGSCNACNKVRSTRSACSHYNTNFSCRTGIAVCRMACPLFMSRQNMADSVTIFIKFVINIQDCTAWISKNGINPLFYQTFNYNT